MKSPNVSPNIPQKSPVSEQTAKRSTIETGRLHKAPPDPQTRSPVLHPHIPGSARPPPRGASSIYKATLRQQSGGLKHSQTPGKQPLHGNPQRRHARREEQTKFATCIARSVPEGRAHERCYSSLIGARLRSRPAPLSAARTRSGLAAPIYCMSFLVASQPCRMAS